MNFKLYTLSAFLFVNIFNLKAQNIDFSYLPLKQYLLSSSSENKIAKDVKGNSIAIDSNGDGEISYEEALNVFYLYVDVQNMWSLSPSNINDFSTEELKFFSNIEIINCAGTSVSAVVPSKPIYFIDLSGLINLKEFYGQNNLRNGGIGIKFPQVMPKLKIAHYFQLFDFLDISQAPNVEEIEASNAVIENAISLKKLNTYGEKIHLKNLPNLAELEIRFTSQLYLEDLPKIIDLDIDTYSASDLNEDSKDMNKSITINNLPNLVNLRTTLLSMGETTGLAGLHKLNLFNLPKLEYLDCSKNRLSILDVSNLGSLSKLNASNNFYLRSINLNEHLKQLDLSGNKSLEELEVKKLVNLTKLNLSKTAIKTIDLTQNLDLEELITSESNISELDLTKNQKIKFFELISMTSNKIDLRKLNIKNKVLDLWIDEENKLIPGIFQNYLEFICVDPEELTYFNQDVSNIFPNLNKFNAKITSDCEPYYKDDLPQEEDKDNPSVTVNNPDKEEIQSLITSNSIYPNPVKDQLFINTKQKVNDIEIYDINGKLVSKQSIFDNKVDTSFLSKGVYILITYSSLGKDKHKFIKQ